MQSIARHVRPANNIGKRNVTDLDVSGGIVQGALFRVLKDYWLRLPPTQAEKLAGMKRFVKQILLDCLARYAQDLFPTVRCCVRTAEQLLLSLSSQKSPLVPLGLSPVV